MDTTTQIVLIIMIIVLGSTLSIVGVMFFFILKEARESMRKINTILDDVKSVSTNISTGSQVVQETVVGLRDSVEMFKNEFSSPVSLLLGFVKGFKSAHHNRGDEDDE